MKFSRLVDGMAGRCGLTVLACRRGIMVTLGLSKSFWTLHLHADRIGLQRVYP